MESMSKGVGNEPSAAELCDSGYGFDNTEVSSGPHQTQGQGAPFWGGNKKSLRERVGVRQEKVDGHTERIVVLDLTELFKL